MVLLPEGFGLPPLPHLVGLLVAVAFVAAGIARRRPTVTDRHVVAFAPWMAVGSCLHVLYVVGGLPAAVRPLAGTPAVYLSVAAIAGATWLLIDVAAAGLDQPTDATPETKRVPATIAAVGVTALLPVVATALAVGSDAGALTPRWPAIALVVSIGVGALAWVGLVRLVPRASVTGGVGALAVLGHALDAVSTAVGVDVLGFSERTPLSRLIMEGAAALPTADLLGVGWLFILVKLTLVCGIVVLFVDYVEEDPTEGYLLLGFIAAVGLGPGAHNLLLFTVAGGA
ncbi:Uncharacterized membrane protein [Halopenitus malekzadehii]|uniref:Uncharacterized membrane protein n=1 Tax=Halopenitus malekzadehii TaxID=1267564 RepID=A0A1H6IJR4_9EURY|nr:DUF63 family protein [Halopenitus malekzadehii]SEH49220.1 Uncharacterized membrane protein [Halopenitus malekzadehii]